MECHVRILSRSRALYWGSKYIMYANFAGDASTHKPKSAALGDERGEKTKRLSCLPTCIDSAE